MNWNWLTAPGLVLALSACGPTPIDAPANPPVTSVPPSVESTDPPVASDWQISDGTVTEVVDGDTVWVTGISGAREKIRVLAIDTPETVDPRKPVECGGLEASKFARDTLLSQDVRLIPDPTQAVLDKYQRGLFYIELAEGPNVGADYSTLAAEAGMGHAYSYDPRRPPQRIAQIQAAESRASAAHRGMWGHCAVPQ